MILRWFFKSKVKNDTGSFNPSRLEHCDPLSPQREAELRGLYYDCRNVRDLLNELDRRDRIIKDQDHELWKIINKKKGK